MANKKGESTDCSVYRTVRISRPIGLVGKEGKGRGKRKEERGRTDRRRGEGKEQDSISALIFPTSPLLKQIFVLASFACLLDRAYLMCERAQRQKSNIWTRISTAFLCFVFRIAAICRKSKTNLLSIIFLRVCLSQIW